MSDTERRANAATTVAYARDLLDDVEEVATRDITEAGFHVLARRCRELHMLLDGLVSEAAREYLGICHSHTTTEEE